MKKSFCAILTIYFFLFSFIVFAGKITISKIPDICIADDGNPMGTTGDGNFGFSIPFLFADYVTVSCSCSTNPVTISYVVVDSSPTIDSRLQLQVEGVTHPLTTTGGETEAVVLGEYKRLDSGDAGIEAGNLFLEYVNTSLLDATLDYSRVVRFIADNGDDEPGIGSVFIFLEEKGYDRFGDVSILFIDTFDTDSEGWIFTSILGNSVSTSNSGKLNITYNNTGVFSYWQRPIGGGSPVCPPLEANTLYRVTAGVSSSVPASVSRGDIPDFRIATGLANGANILYFVSGYIGDGSANYISPMSSGRDYEIYFEATGTYPGHSSDLVMTFEGFNFPLNGFPDRVGETISLTRIELNKFPDYDVDEGGVLVHSIADVSGFTTGSGSINGWMFTSPNINGNAGTSGHVAADGEGLTIRANELGENFFAYGSWDANPKFATSPIAFNGGTLYRATFKITTSVVASPSTNQPIPKVRVQTGDSHVAFAANLYSNLGSAENKQLTADELTTPDIDLWFYYPVNRVAEYLNEDKVFPAFELLILSGISIPDGAALTLRGYSLTAHNLPTYQ